MVGVVLFSSAKIAAMVVNTKEKFEIMEIRNINLVKHVQRIRAVGFLSVLIILANKIVVRVQLTNKFIISFYES